MNIFGYFDGSLLNKSIDLFKKMLLTQDFCIMVYVNETCIFIIVSHQCKTHVYADICMSCRFSDPQLKGKHLVVLFWQSFVQYTCPTTTSVL